VRNRDWQRNETPRERVNGAASARTGGSSGMINNNNDDGLPPTTTMTTSETAGGTTAPEGDQKRVSLHDLERKKTDGVVRKGALSPSDRINRTDGSSGINNHTGEPTTTMTTTATTTTEQVDDTSHFADLILPGAQRIGRTTNYSPIDCDESTPTMVDWITHNDSIENTVDVTTTQEGVMINAQIVDEEQLEAQIVARHTRETRNQVMREAVEATSVVEDQTQNKKTTESSVDTSSSFLQRYWVLSACFVVALAAIILIVVVAVKSKNDESEDSNETTDDSKLSIFQELVNLLSPLSGSDVLLNETTPQFAAMKWFTKDMESNTTSTFISSSSSMDVSNMLLERYSVALLYFSTQGAIWLDSLDFLSHNTSVCQWQSLQGSVDDALGINCDADGSVTKVQLGTYRCSP
jgi:hypothetical protein